MVSPWIVFLVVTTFLFLIIRWFQRRRNGADRVEQLINQLPGPPPLPGIGNMLEINVAHEELFTRLTIMNLMWGGELGIIRAWQASKPYVFLFKANTAEPILSSSKHITKSNDYYYLRPWLGTGLLTSDGSKWHSRRKILTPTFHFRILEDFIDVFQEQSTVLVKRLQGEVSNSGFNIFPYVTLCTLDIICETAMGRQIHAQYNSDSEYVKAVYELGDIVHSRQCKLQLQPDWLFRLSSLYKRHQNCIRILHDMSNKVIRERREEIRLQKQKQQACNGNGTHNGKLRHEIPDDVVIGKKKRLAFLDLLIEASREGTVLSNEDIREEVDTFMFEGHDTTSAAISWCLFLLGSDLELQERVFEELYRVLGDEPISMKNLQELRYLECCIKEALRLYPSVPMMGRLLREDVEIAGYTIPAGTATIIMPYLIHRDPTIFPRPEVFDPDRFLPDNVQGRHPYAYIPFSAGPRNCIGQKFALLEEKAIIATVLRHFRVTAVDRRDNIKLLAELILRPKNGLSIRIEPRAPLRFMIDE